MKFETPFDLNGDLIVVDAVVVGPAGQATVELVVDTGSVLTTLAPSLAEAIGYSEAIAIRRTVTRTAVGEEHGYLVRLVELSTLGHTVPAVHVNVAALGYGVDGLLGMSFLLDFNIEILPAERRIIVERITP